MIRVLVWNENYHEQIQPEIKAIYPNGIHGAIKDFLSKDEELEVKTATLEDPECGLTEEVLENTDVLIWWGHVKHFDVPDEIAARVQRHVLKGMGFVALHSAHHSKPFRMLMGTDCGLRWRDGDRERVWNINPSHPIARGIGDYFEIEKEEMYGEQFHIPDPDEIVFLGWFAGGEVMRSGCCFKRGCGKIFYFQPGHEANPTYYNENVQKVIDNAVHWAAPYEKNGKLDAPMTESPEKNR